MNIYYIVACLSFKHYYFFRHFSLRTHILIFFFFSVAGTRITTLRTNKEIWHLWETENEYVHDVWHVYTLRPLALLYFSYCEIFPVLLRSAYAPTSYYYYYYMGAWEITSINIHNSQNAKIKAYNLWILFHTLQLPTLVWV